MGSILNKTDQMIIKNNPVSELLEECDFDHKPADTRTFIICIKLYGYTYPAMIDTGSTICAFSDEVWSQLSEAQEIIPSFPCTGVRVIGAFKSKYKKVSIQALLTFTICGEIFSHEFLLIPSLVYPLIVGVDFLRLHNAKICLDENVLKLKLGGKSVFVPEVQTNHAFKDPAPIEIAALVNNNTYCSLSKYSGELEPKRSDFSLVLSKCCLSETEKLCFKDLLNKYSSIFSNIPGRTSLYEHTLKLKDDKEFFIKPYPIPVAHRDAVAKAISQMESWGVIERASTPYISPLMTTIKKDGSVRVCLDARHLNSVLEPDRELPLRIGDIIRTLNGKKYLSKIDLSHSYWQLPLRESDRKFTGFMVGTKTYQFCVLPFGISTAVSSFTRAMDTVFGRAYDDFLISYVDDLLVASFSFSEHLQHLEQVFSRLQDCGFTVKISKCSFFQTEMHFLGYIVSPKGVRPDPARVQAIVDYQVPRNMKEVQRFLGLCNFDRFFTPKFAELSEPLTQLLRKKSRWKWGQAQQQAFQGLKEELQTATLLYHPNHDLPWHVTTDASDIGISGQLFQVVDDRKRVVAWASRLLIERERHYHSNEKEVLAALYCLQRWRNYLLSSKFTLYTDNRALTYLNTCRLLSPRITRWALALQEFSFDIVHIPGRENVAADALSRHACGRLPTPSDKCFQMFALHLPSQFQNILKNIKSYQLQDPRLVNIRNQINSDETLNKRYVLIKDILYKRGSDENILLLCIPECLIKDIIINFHISLGHFGVYKTWVALRDEVHFHNMQRTIKKYIKTCDICQKAKISILPNPPQKQIVPESKEDLLAIDVLGPLVRSRAGVCYILVVFNVFTKYITLFPLKKATSRVMINCLVKKYFPVHGQPKRILHDNATQYSSKLWKFTFESLGIRLVYVSVRHARANPSERCMREIARILRTYCHDHHSKWAVNISLFEEFLNSVVHEATGFAPNELQFGEDRNRLLPPSVSPPACTLLSPEQKLVLAEASLKSKAERRAIRYPGRPYVRFAIGDAVLLKANNLSSALKAETKKLLLLFEGPYRIKKEIRDDTYVLGYMENQKERGVFHASHLKRYNYMPP